MSHYRVAILTVSDTASLDPTHDKSGPTVKEILLATRPKTHFEITKTGIVADDEPTIKDWVRSVANSNDCDLILTTGGTGFGEKDRTPEAISSLIERPAPGLVHLLLSSSLKHTPFAALSRPVAGTVGKTLVVTLPGSPKAVRENLAALLTVVGHALDLIRGGSGAAVHKDLASQDGTLTATSPSKVDAPTQVHGTTGHPVHVRHSSNEPIKVTQNPGYTGPAHHVHTHHDRAHGHHHQPPKPRTSHLSNDPSLPVSSRHRVSQYPMVPFADAVATVLRNCKVLDTVIRKVDNTLPGHVLAEDVFAPQNVPFTRTTNVDGYALRSEQGPGTYKVVTPATRLLSQQLDADTVMRVNTGAPIPVGTNAVIMVEDTKLASTRDDGDGNVEEELVTTLAAVRPDENVRQPGSDVMKGEKVCELGEVLGSGGGEIGSLAFVGRREAKVFRKPRVAILSTGNELTDIQSTVRAETNTAEQWTGIWDTNRPSLRAALEGLGYEVVDLGIVPDTVDAHVQAVKRGLDAADVLVTTGGSSMGATDLLKPVIERHLHGTIHFGRVAIKPGKPTTFATVPVSTSGTNATPSESGPPASPLSPTDKVVNKPIFALPGNPASALVMFWMFVVPALRRLGGYPRERCTLPHVKVFLTEDLPLDPRPEFHRITAWTKIVRFIAHETGKIHFGQPVDLSIDVGLTSLPGKAPVIVNEIIATSVFDPKARLTDRKLTIKKILAPLSRNQLGTAPVRCIGLNYKDHAAEAKVPLPNHPNLFYKPPLTIIGHNRPIVIPKVAQPVELHLPDYEVELVIVLKKKARDVPESEALDYVLGYTVGNDVSFRHHQFAVTQWGFSKSFDKTTPLGPCIVSASAIDPSNLRVKTVLNGEVRQDGTTANMVFDVKKLISQLSQGTTLCPGTVIYTGTPGGVGVFANPKVYLKDGDEVRVWVENIGTLVNPVVEEGRPEFKAKL
ncbi:hypothetical protein FRB99_005983 [Tulasnella sp. 403]|nr:hypothetical protein FRB99_005983 [Tulasnella sp. 403]